MINIQKLHKSYQRFKALEDINCEWNAGQVVSLIGPNGSGKTTLIKCILGLVHPETGNILLNGKSILDNYDYRSAIGYMPQIGRFPDHLKVNELFRLLIELREEYHNKLDYELYKAYHIDSIAHKTMRSLSGGTRQKVSAALAFLFSPSIYILDEPTAGLDPISSEILKDKISLEHRNGKFILLTSHILSDLEDLTTDVLYLQEGKIKFQLAVEKIRTNTGENKLSRAIAKMLLENLYISQSSLQ